ncbi:LCP family protein [Nocardioides sambongensis]|uniref:LCP family protein n=1 Tax=Nocardioides sambongensis TaxID=2589074 RepID=UPI001E34FC45|nr:LCP family protein [Nocardioides sambongensis]
MAFTLLAPGSAQLIAGNRKVGLVALRIWIGLLCLGALGLVVSALDHSWAITLAFNSDLLLLLRLGLFAAAIGWAALFMDAWRLGQPLTLGLPQRRAVVGVNGLLCLSVAGTLLFGAHLVGVQRDLSIALFGNTAVSGAHDGRFNVLLLGGDSGAGRWGLRPDSLTVASIDAETGKAVLVGLPRNLENFPFRDGSVMDEQFPDGFDCDGCYINGVSTWAEDHTDLFGESETPGVDATVSAVEGVTGLRINYWAMVNLQGFKDLVDAVGGITLNVRQPIPVGGLGDDVTGYIDPGKRTLDGFETLWYARAREGSDDYSRMARQKCVLNGFLQQVSPQTALTNFEELAEATTGMFSTNLPASEVGRFVELGLKTRSQKVATVSLVPPKVNTAEPDIDEIRQMVADAVASSEGSGGDDAGTTARKKRNSTVTGGSIGSRDGGYAANESDDLSSAC